MESKIHKLGNKCYIQAWHHKNIISSWLSIYYETMEKDQSLKLAQLQDVHMFCCSF